MSIALSKNPPPGELGHDGVERVGVGARKLAQQLVFERFVPLHVVALAVDAAEQTHGGHLGHDAEFACGHNDFFVGKEVDIQRKIVESGFAGTCHSNDKVLMCEFQLQYKDISFYRHFPNINIQ